MNDRLCGNKDGKIICSVSSDEQGFYGSFLSGKADEAHATITVIGPNCGARFDVGWKKEAK